MPERVQCRLKENNMKSNIRGQYNLVNLEEIDGVIFDMDGVVTDTAHVHATAWKKLFDECLEERARRLGEAFLPFDEEYDYQRYVDGKPRQDGVRAFLASRGIKIPQGDISDGPEAETAYGLGNRKNRYFLEALEKIGARAYESTIRLIEELKSRGLRVAVISSSRNAERILKAAGVRELFEVKIDGEDMAKFGLRGKPEPDIFIEAARLLGIAPARAAIVEDAIAGVEAGRKGGFRYVIGVDRSRNGKGLAEWGANLVVRDLAEITFERSDVEVPVRNMTDLPSAWNSKEDIFQQVWKGTFALFLDYDGTLTPIVEDPDQALLPSRMKSVLRRLADRGTVAILSGRDLNDVKSKIGLDNVIYAGSHGFDVSGPGAQHFAEMGHRFLPALDWAEAQLKPVIDGIPGARLERKRYAIALHFRQVKEDSAIEELEGAVQSVVEGEPQLRYRGGKKILEIIPNVDWDKGKALLGLLNTLFLDGADIAPLFVGDDITDEDAFKAVRRRGVGVVVGTDSRPSAARYVLESPEEVLAFLDYLAGLAEGKTTIGIWSLTYEDYDPNQEKLREALCTLGNGHFATRGAAPEAQAGEQNYPGTYVAGCYNRLATHIAGRTIENESLVNAPNWLSFLFRLEGCEWFNLHEIEILEYRQELNLHKGILTRAIRFKDKLQRHTRIVQRRIVSIRNPHLACLETTIVPEDWSGSVDICSALDGRVANTGVARYRQLDSDHLSPVYSRPEGEDSILLQVETNQSKIRISEAARTRVMQNGAPVQVQFQVVQEPRYISQEFTLHLQEKQPVTVEKMVALFTSRDLAISESGLAALNATQRAPAFDKLLEQHVLGWDHLWHRCGLTLEDNERSSLILNLHVFHLLQTVSVHTIDLDAGVPARGLHGEAYRGHIFWDEVFILPFLNFSIPDITRSLLQYRYRRLNEARRAASEAGYAGAMYPWQSGSDGREESQVLHLNPMSGRWLPDHTYLQRHINSVIAYNIWNYYQVTNDIDYLSFYGAEMIIEIARFWASIAHYDRARDRYEIHGVMGPDEYHDGYPGKEEPGINNNAYTNVMAVWVLCRALDILDLLPEDRKQSLHDNLNLRMEEIEKWDDISRKMLVPFHDGNIVSQFEGYENLEEFDWEGYRDKYGRIERLDRILEAEEDTPNRYKVSKQADLLMLFYLFSPGELIELFYRLGYDFDTGMIHTNIEYYLKRTSHGSTLSRVVHSWVLSRSQRELSWLLFKDALESDVSDVQGGTTPEGIHLGAMAGSVDVIQRCYTGIVTRSGVLWFDPYLPEELKSLSLYVRYHQQWIEVKITQDSLSLSATRRGGLVTPVQVGFRDQIRELRPGDSLEFELRPSPAGVRTKP